MTGTPPSLTLTELLIETGFDKRAPTEYQTSDGALLTVTRDDLKFNGDALLARDRLLYTAAGATGLGAWCGFGGALLCLALFRQPEPAHPVQRMAVEPAPPASAAPMPALRKPLAGSGPGPPPKAKPKQAPPRAPVNMKRVTRARRWF